MGNTAQSYYLTNKEAARREFESKGFAGSRNPYVELDLQ